MPTNRSGLQIPGRGHQGAARDPSVEAAITALADVLLEIASAKSSPVSEDEKTAQQTKPMEEVNDNKGFKQQ